ncbi:MAG TPA: type IV toxin-antitoxin system AbiEi family antitoxin domain-containing protein [Acidobacteriota bacterium]|nr:type IV toxin-antitoxin system AbiEi family antitoxin domain-containing protein [Acidobacteriota bacterium]HQM63023.1 type IV toxin-antitoxin system AbiEi family antitoxin domain-containing protein [Acidobacteriota bacterium]
MNDAENKLFSIAETQQGYFTTRQAREAGYSYETHHYHVARGTWIREARGIYRLARFPVTEEGQYVLWSLWSCGRDGNPQGVYSHQTALSLYELSDVMPLRLHMTVPKSFRRSSALPAVLILHKGELGEPETEQRSGYRVTRPLRAIADLLQSGTESLDRLTAALREGLARGLITSPEIEHSALRESLKSLLKE